jgi:hypothetical protein
MVGCAGACIGGELGRGGPSWVGGSYSTQILLQCSLALTPDAPVMPSRIAESLLRVGRRSEYGGLKTETLVSLGPHRALAPYLTLQWLKIIVFILLLEGVDPRCTPMILYPRQAVGVGGQARNSE